jgi:hypothetical protein
MPIAQAWIAFALFWAEKMRLTQIDSLSLTIAGLERPLTSKKKRPGCVSTPAARYHSR